MYRILIVVLFGIVACGRPSYFHQNASLYKSDDLIVSDVDSLKRPPGFNNEIFHVNHAIYIKNTSQTQNYEIVLDKAHFVLEKSSGNAQCESADVKDKVFIAPGSIRKIDCRLEVTPSAENKLLIKHSELILQIPYKGKSEGRLSFKYPVRYLEFQ